MENLGLDMSYYDLDTEKVSVKNRFKRVTLDLCIKLAKEFYMKYGRSPGVTDFDNLPGYPHSCFIRDTSGLKWNEFLSLCNLPLFTNGEAWIKNRNAELIAKSKLIEAGYSVEDLSEKNMNAPHAFIVNGNITVDVRYSAYVFDKTSKKTFWKFRLHLGNKKEMPDYFIGVGFNDKKEYEEIFIFPTNEITVKESISINVNALNKSKYGIYRLSDNNIVLKKES